MLWHLASPLTDAEQKLLEAIGLSSDRYRAVVRRRLTIAISRRFYVPGLVFALLVFLLVARHHGLVWGALAAAVAGLALTLSLVAHEVGHLLVGRRAGGVVPRLIVVRASGGISVVEGRHESPRDAALFAAGGPIGSTAAGLVCLAAALTLPWPALQIAWGFAAAMNGVLLVVNLIPVAPMDGYLLFRSALWAEVGDRLEAERRALEWSRVLVAWTLAASLVLLGHDQRYGIAALLIVLTFAVQHHATARRSAAERARPRRRR